MVGARLGEMTSQGYSMLPIPGSGGAPGDAQVHIPSGTSGSQAIPSLTTVCGVERQALVHVHPSGDELNSGEHHRSQTTAIAGLRR